SAKVRGGRARQIAIAEASRPSTKNVSVKLPRMNAMASCMEVSPGEAAAPAAFACDDPHPIIGFAHLTKRRSIRPAVERSGSGRCRGVVHSCTQGAPRSLGGLAKPSRSYYVPSGRRAGNRARMLRWSSSLCPLWPAHMIAPTDRMNDLFDQGRPRRQASADGARVIAIRGAREHNLKNIDL